MGPLYRGPEIANEPEVRAIINYHLANSVAYRGQISIQGVMNGQAILLPYSHTDVQTEDIFSMVGVILI